MRLPLFQFSRRQSGSEDDLQNPNTENPKGTISEREANVRGGLGVIAFTASFAIVMITTGAALFKPLEGIKKLSDFPNESSSTISLEDVIKYNELVIEYNRELDAQRRGTFQWVTTSTFPTISTWIGTILAFYFSSGAFAAASEVSREVSKNTDETYRKIVESTASSLNTQGGLNKLKQRKLSEEETGLTFFEDNLDLKLSAVVAKLRKHSRQRLLVVNKEDDLKEDGSFNTIVQLANIIEFARSTEPDVEDSDLDNTSLRTYLTSRGEETMLPVVFASQEMTLYDAYKLMQQESPPSRDLIVTATGKRTEKVLAYLTDFDINKYVD